MSYCDNDHGDALTVAYMSGYHRGLDDRAVLVEEIAVLNLRIGDLEASPMAEEALDILRSANHEILAELEVLRQLLREALGWPVPISWAIDVRHAIGDPSV